MSRTPKIKQNKKPLVIEEQKEEIIEKVSESEEEEPEEEVDEIQAPKKVAKPRRHPFQPQPWRYPDRRSQQRARREAGGRLRGGRPDQRRTGQAELVAPHGGHAVQPGPTLQAIQAGIRLGAELHWGRELLCV